MITITILTIVGSYQELIQFVFFSFSQPSHMVDFAAAQFRQYERLTKQMKPSEVGDEYERTKQRMYNSFKLFPISFECPILLSPV